MRSAFELRLREGWLPERKNTKKHQSIKPTKFLSGLELKLEETIKGNYSYHHKMDCGWVLQNWRKYSSAKGLLEATTNEIDNATIKNSSYSQNGQQELKEMY